MKTHELIKKIRLKMLMEQAEFGDLIGVSKQAISQYECARRFPRMKHARILLELAKKTKIKCTIENFFE